MLQTILAHVLDENFMVRLLVAVATAATIITVALPLLEPDTLARRMKSVSSERDRIRARERERLSRNGKGSLRAEPKAFMARIVESFSASKWLGTEKAKTQLAQAGYRGPQAEVGFLFFRLVSPAAFLLVTVFYLFFVTDFGLSFGLKSIAVIFSAYLGLKAPEIFLSNTTTKRQKSLRLAFPDTLDLLLICVESGMSIEHAFRKVSLEIGAQSAPMAEELTLVTAELSFLQDRRQAFENFAARTGLESVRALSTVLIQSEKYGTPLGAALRVLAQEGRDNRMLEAEKKAASLPPKLTVPMILFFLPVLFVIIGTPLVLQIMESPVSR